MGDRPVHGLYVSDVRIVSLLELTFDGQPGETIATEPRGASAVDFVSVLRTLDDDSADPRVRAVHRRTVVPQGSRERLTLSSTLAAPIETTIQLRIATDLQPMDAIKAGSPAERRSIAIGNFGATWSHDEVAAELVAPGASFGHDADGALQLTWRVTVPPKGEVAVEWAVSAEDSSAVVAAATGAIPWTVPTEATGDDRLDRWLARALDDLDALRMTTVANPDVEFLAAGAPWFFTLFGRDSIWAARFLLPLGYGIAADTLRVLAGMQGTESVDATAEQPGKIMHELRRGALEIPSAGVTLPPLYYGTIDATPLWVCLLADAAEWGMPAAEVEALLPNLRAALAWMRDCGDSDGDGLLEYVDSTGHGLANQGWKDSGDSVQWRDGRLATGPIALCEVQGYAYEAAVRGAELLERFGQDGTQWRTWATALKAKFDSAFWIEDAAGAYPAIALDAAKQRVDTVTSNIGHLLGTGILDAEQSALVARRLVSSELDSGFGLRTMSTDSAGYWPLSYHGGSVWTHDTAIAIRGLHSAGFPAEAAKLTSGLLAAASRFDYRMPELHSGDAATEFASPVPYPAACRPQAWSAAASVAVYAAAAGLRPPA
jgi:glycogen debranching enzyme